MATIRILLGIICLTFAGRLVQPDSYILESWKAIDLGYEVNHVRTSKFFSASALTSKRATGNEKRIITKRPARNEKRSNLKNWKVERLGSWHVVKRTTPNEQRIAKHETANRIRVIAIAKSQIGVREETGNNDGQAVEKYLAYTGNKKGDPWCASFVSWVHGAAGYNAPKTAWSPSLFPKERKIKRPSIASIFGIYFPKMKRIAHCGMVAKVNGDWIYTIEGNTNPEGNRDGDGVYQRIRHQRMIATYADWLQEKGGGR